jgi:hypothetical protein
MKANRYGWWFAFTSARNFRTQHNLPLKGLWLISKCSGLCTMASSASNNCMGRAMRYRPLAMRCARPRLTGGTVRTGLRVIPKMTLSARSPEAEIGATAASEGLTL